MSSCTAKSTIILPCFAIMASTMFFLFFLSSFFPLTAAGSKEAKSNPTLPHLKADIPLCVCSSSSVLEGHAGEGGGGGLYYSGIRGESGTRIYLPQSSRFHLWTALRRSNLGMIIPNNLSESQKQSVVPLSPSQEAIQARKYWPVLTKQ